VLDKIFDITIYEYIFFQVKNDGKIYQSDGKMEYCVDSIA